MLWQNGRLHNVRSDILKVAHHGSKYSSDEEFLRRVRPCLSLIEVGKDNGYGHPDSNVVSRLKKYSDVYTTAECGEIRIRMYQKSIKIIE